MDQAGLERFVGDFAENVVREQANAVEELEAIMVVFKLDPARAHPIYDIGVLPLGPFMARDKDQCRLAVHLTLTAERIDGYIFVTEAWMAVAAPHETLECFEATPPSRRENRKTILKVSGRLRCGHNVSFICEASNLTGERFTKPFENFGAAESGRFANFFEEANA